MGFGGIGPVGLILLVIVALLLFGPSKLPELGRAFGRTLKEFKNGAKDIMSDDDEDEAPKKRKEVNGTITEPSKSDNNADEKKDKRLPE